MKNFISDSVLVALGAIPGAWLRLRVVQCLRPIIGANYLGILIINIIACFGLGFTNAITKNNNYSSIFLFLGVGFFCSFSSFSTFINDILHQILEKEFNKALILTTTSVFGGLIAAWVGHQLIYHDW